MILRKSEMRELLDIAQEVIERGWFLPEKGRGGLYRRLRDKGLIEFVRVPAGEGFGTSGRDYSLGGVIALTELGRREVDSFRSMT